MLWARMDSLITSMTGILRQRSVFLVVLIRSQPNVVVSSYSTASRLTKPCPADISIAFELHKMMPEYEALVDGCCNFPGPQQNTG